ncbi:MAG: alpha/beta hydrolase [Fimbriimonadaceae bacterium]
MLQRLIHPPRVPAANPPLLVLLHGLGADECDLIGLAPELDPRLMVVSFRAPRTCQFGGFAWFDVQWDADGVHVDDAQALESRTLALEALAALPSDLGIQPPTMFLGGFSQGAMMSLGIALAIPEKLDGVLLLSGRLLPSFAADQLVISLAHLPFLVQHGLCDPVLPVQGSREIRAYLEERGAPVTYGEYSMAHEVSRQGLADAATWLDALMP